MIFKRHLLGPLIKAGVPVHFPALVDDPELTHDNLYALKLINVDVSKGGLEYVPSEHIFTEKELVRATERYHNEAEIVAEGPCSTDSEPCLGYVTIRTYTNKSNILTTRFIIRFSGKGVCCMGDMVCVGMFTAREIKRSADRMSWYIKRHDSLFHRFMRWCSGK